MSPRPIHRDRFTLGGQPHLAGTRLSTQTIYLTATNNTLAELAEIWPDLSAEELAAVMRFEGRWWRRLRRWLPQVTLWVEWPGKPERMWDLIR